MQKNLAAPLAQGHRKPLSARHVNFGVPLASLLVAMTAVTTLLGGCSSQPHAAGPRLLFWGRSFKDGSLTVDYGTFYVDASQTAVAGGSPSFTKSATKIRESRTRCDKDSGRWCEQLRSLTNGTQWSPDGQMVLSETYEGIVIAKADGTDAHLVTGPRSFYAAWSPNSDRIAFQAPSSKKDQISIWLFDLNGGHLRELTRDLLSDSGEGGFRPVWFPDGNRILVTAFDGVSNNIFEFNVDTLMSRKLFRSFDADIEEVGSREHPTLSPDGSMIAFPSDDGKVGIGRLDPDGTSESEFTLSADVTKGGGAQDVLWSPDGKSLAVSTYDGSIWMVDPTAKAAAKRVLLPKGSDDDLVRLLGWMPPSARCERIQSDGWHWTDNVCRPTL